MPGVAVHVVGLGRCPHARRGGPPATAAVAAATASSAPICASAAAAATPAVGPATAWNAWRNFRDSVLSKGSEVHYSLRLPVKAQTAFGALPISNSVTLHLFLQGTTISLHLPCKYQMAKWNLF